MLSDIKLDCGWDRIRDQFVLAHNVNYYGTARSNFINANEMIAFVESDRHVGTALDCQRAKDFIKK